jgi:hypothetical protein
MCNSKSFCSCVGSLDHFCQCFTQFLVQHSTIQYCKFWLFCINTPHNTHLNCWLLLLALGILNRTPTSHVHLLRPPNLVFACSFIVSLLATIWTCYRWFVWTKKLTLSTKLFASWAPRPWLFYRRPCCIIVFDFINACWKDAVSVCLLYALKFVVGMHQIL